MKSYFSLVICGPDPILWPLGICPALLEESACTRMHYRWRVRVSHWRRSGESRGGRLSQHMRDTPCLFQLCPVFISWSSSRSANQIMYKPVGLVCSETTSMPFMMVVSCKPTCIHIVDISTIIIICLKPSQSHLSNTPRTFTLETNV